MNTRPREVIILRATLCAEYGQGLFDPFRVPAETYGDSLRRAKAGLKLNAFDTGARRQLSQLAAAAALTTLTRSAESRDSHDEVEKYEAYPTNGSHYDPDHGEFFSLLRCFLRSSHISCGYFAVNLRGENYRRNGERPAAKNRDNRYY